MLNVKKAVLILSAAMLLQGCAQQAVIEVADIVYPPAPNEPRFYYQETLVHSGQIEIESEDKLMQRIMLGESRTVFGFGKPIDLVARNGRLYVSDSTGRKVLILDRGAGKVTEIRDAGLEQIRMPFAIKVSDAGDIYVVDGTLKKVLVFDAQGDYLRSIGTSDMFDKPSGLAVTGDGTRVYVSDTGGVESIRHQIRVFDGHSGEHLYDLGSRGAGPGQFNLPKNIVLTPDGLLAVNDSANFRIQLIDPKTGEMVRSIGSIGMSFGQFARPKGIDVDADGNIYVADALLGNLQIFNKEGQLLMHIGQRSESNGPGNYLLPAGLAVDEDGRVYMIDQFFAKIDVFRPANLSKYEGSFALPLPKQK
mgnify:CR=1 FL=1|jgi:DNA-binding beta-propeller fold protein YncE